MVGFSLALMDPPGIRKMTLRLNPRKCQAYLILALLSYATNSPKDTNFDCIFGVADTAFSYFLTQFAFADIRHGRRDVNEHGRAYNQDGSYVVAHVAIANGSTLHQAHTDSSSNFD